MIMTPSCQQRLHHRCPGRGPAGAVRCECRCHISSASQLGDIRLAEAQLIREVERDSGYGALTSALGFHPLVGGRRLGELRCSRLTEASRVFIEMPGSWVTVEQAKAISAILRDGFPL